MFFKYMESILEDSGLQDISKVLNTKLYFSNSILKDIILKSANFPNVSEIIETQNTIEKLKNIDTNDLQPYFDSLEAKEKECEYFLNQHKKIDSLEVDSLEKNTFGQLIFTSEYFKTFNHLPYLLMIVAYFKKICIPFFSIMVPLLAYFLPMLLIKYVWKLPINLNIYNKIMSHIWSFDISSPEKLLQNCFTVFTISQSIYQIIQNALHLHTIDTNIVQLGRSVFEYNEIVKSLQNRLKESSSFKESTSLKVSKLLDDLYNDSRKTFVQIIEEPYRFLMVAKDMARLEILWKIAKHPDSSKVQIYSSKTPYFKAKELFDINLKNRVPSSIDIRENHQHFLLSGPNGGGKSSYLRAILQTILLSHSFGYAFGKSIELSPFDYILSGLSIHDIPGKLSLFEKEVCFARDVLYYNNPDYKGFVLFDEIFHSTNPPDGIRTSNLFLNTLWNYSHVASIVSTHVFEIIEQSPDFVKKICVDAEKDVHSDKLIYKYAIKDGISRLSSVSEIWKKEFI